ncbi:leucine--tRNA ligase [Patescibacteria group bacterium]|nr:MAG: leucine--tRNA ligase [Patescibacteria group bacterium]
MKYPHREIEKKWQERWSRERADQTPPERVRAKKRYVLDMFPYPSAEGLHVGHPEGYTATDIFVRKLRMEGYDVLHPMGWDAFGLPTENYAIKVGQNPKEIAARNIENFRRQIKSLGFSYDWSRELNTADPSYYKWTQWLFLLLYKRGLAYRVEAPVNWCPKDQTVLANEQVADGCCERCGSAVEQRELEQWFFKITEYAERLLSGLETLDWPERIKTMQKNWLGKSEGTRIIFRGRTPEGKEYEIPVFTTRPDTLLGVTYLVLAPEHPLIEQLVFGSWKLEVEKYIAAAKKKSERERGETKEKTGVSLGAEALHPLTGEHLPIWIADYVLPHYGTGAVMGVPAHDERDFVFAKKYGLPSKWVIAPPHDSSHAQFESAFHGEIEVRGEIGSPPRRSNLHRHEFGAYTGLGILVNSGEFNGLTSEDAKVKITDALIAAGLGQRETTWHLRDWLVSRQRYWGAPIPIIRCEHCGDLPVPEKDLPVLLPDDVDFRPTGESPLARSKSFHKVNCPDCGKKARRESDTMDTFVDSSWYFLRYCSPKDDEHPFDPETVDYWCPVDLYVGGAEHAVLHLLYARFVTMVLKDAGFISFSEPFTTLKNQGLILGQDGQKMSKSRGNVINPDDVVVEYGADTLRLYEMFMGPLEDSKPWDIKGIIGVRRFLERVYGLAVSSDIQHPSISDVEHPNIEHPNITRLLHKTIKKVTEDINSLRFNTAFSALMIFSNEIAVAEGGRTSLGGPTSGEALENLLILLAPFAPHLAEECWELLGHKTSIFKEKWPSYDAAFIKDAEVTLAVQVGGKLRDTVRLAADASEEEAKAAALKSANVQKWLAGKTITRVVYIPGRLINFVIKGS